MLEAGVCGDPLLNGDLNLNGNRTRFCQSYSKQNYGAVLDARARGCGYSLMSS
jgi:hypothetical protein